MKNDHRSKFSNLSNWKEEAWKNQGFNGIRTRDLTGIAEVTGSNPVEALIFFRLLLSNCLNWKIYCDDYSSLWLTLDLNLKWKRVYILNGRNLKSTSKLSVLVCRCISKFINCCLQGVLVHFLLFLSVSYVLLVSLINDYHLIEIPSS